MAHKPLCNRKSHQKINHLWTNQIRDNRYGSYPEVTWFEFRAWKILALQLNISIVSYISIDEVHFLPGPSHSPFIIFRSSHTQRISFIGYSVSLNNKLGWQKRDRKALRLYISSGFTNHIQKQRTKVAWRRPTSHSFIICLPYTEAVP
jgi:hypothetical protein